MPRPPNLASALAAALAVAAAAAGCATAGPATPSAAAAALLDDMNAHDYQAAWQMYDHAGQVTEKAWEQAVSACPLRIQYTITGADTAGDAAQVTVAYKVTDMQAGWFTPRTTTAFSFTLTGAGWKYDSAGQMVYASPGTAVGKPCALL
jgi:hypothetical protein